MFEIVGEGRVCSDFVWVVVDFFVLVLEICLLGFCIVMVDGKVVILYVDCKKFILFVIVMIVCNKNNCYVLYCEW